MPSPLADAPIVRIDHYSPSLAFDPLTRRLTNGAPTGGGLGPPGEGNHGLLALAGEVRGEEVLILDDMPTADDQVSSVLLKSPGPHAHDHPGRQTAVFKP